MKGKKNLDYKYKECCSPALMHDNDLFYIYFLQKHFDAQQFENRRIDGKWKLKCHAVPTIFFHHKSLKPRKCSKKASANRLATEKVVKKRAILPDHSYCAAPPADSSSRERKFSLFRPTGFSSSIMFRLF